MTILCFHTVEDDWGSTLAIPVAEFENQCRWLAQNRSIVPLDRAVGQLDRKCRLPGRTSALTFDDGWAGVHTNAWPVLRRHGLPFTVFVISETLTGAAPSTDWVERPPDAPLEFLTLDQVREMHAAGVDIASHSSTHADLPSLDERECERDLRSSKELLEDLLEAAVTTVAYPKGRHDQAVRSAAERAGYAAAFTLPETREPIGRFAIPRVGVYPGNDERTLWLKTRYRYLDARLHPAHGAARRLKRALLDVAAR